ncbi:MAG: cysteine desulfurase family protein [Flavobacteriaceae bacterium]
MSNPIYLDNNATTACDDRVLEVMLPFFKSAFANPSSNHALGWLARDAVDKATKDIVETLGILPDELIYTSGATESINMVLKGVYKKYKTKGNHIITLKTEHKAVLDVCEQLSREGARITYLDVDQDGLIGLEQLEHALTPETILVSVMLVNNETGVIQPLEAIAALTKPLGTLLFSDATQALGKLRLDSFFKTVDFACFSGHKLYGPKGIGFTYCNSKNDILPLASFIQGGRQQKGMRGGTLNTPLIVGLSKSILLCYERFDVEQKTIKKLRDSLEKGVLEIEQTTLNGHKEMRVAGTCNISFGFIDGPNLLRALSSRLAISNGSACNSASITPSHVLRAMDVKPDLAHASLRMGVGRYTTEQDINKAIAIITREVHMLRQENILWELRNKA